MPPGGPDMVLGHYMLARHCVWSSGAAHAAPGGRRGRLLDLNGLAIHQQSMEIIEINENHRNQ